MSKDSIIIVREQDELIAACCVPFEGEFVREVGKENLFSNQNDIIQSTGELYQRLKGQYGDLINLDVVDPRNHAYLFPRLVKDIFKYRVSLWQALKTIFALRSPAVVCNGRLISSGQKQLSSKVIDEINEIIQQS
ncbi:hypothetical protein BHF71_08230 [Vulcanibacillus modesticaldus]|uniref:Uncharacterized protein n=1 Tax=Vulcanibacillus modesticaldus TaxID=337097 RepID=A0A1D2YV72_9BACI|nr:hypothetical protein [Vulcanibacillus modesticaldus]OEF99600.1 hypothetical protein BHF71_08230 [Vulcanibacillus modesticaldus]